MREIMIITHEIEWNYVKKVKTSLHWFLIPKKMVDSILSGDTYIFPPSSFEFSVTIIAPIHTITKTCANSGPPSYCVSDVPCNIVAMNVHKINGPHKSPTKTLIRKCLSQFSLIRYAYILWEVLLFLLDIKHDRISHRLPSNRAAGKIKIRLVHFSRTCHTQVVYSAG